MTAGGAFGYLLGRGARGPGICWHARTVARAASSAARGRPRALLLALERGVLSSALECTARGHDQVHVPCIVLFKHESVGYCLMVMVVW